jgi:hypothetical protein
VVLARDSLGTALGLVKGVVAAARLPTAGPSAFVPYALYTEELIADGVWLVIGRDVDLVATFPGRPEIYHRPVRICRKRRATLGTLGGYESATVLRASA